MAQRERAESAKDERQEPLPDDNRPIRPNMLIANANGTSSTIVGTNFSHSVLTQVRFFNSRLHQANLEGAAFDDSDLDGATFTGCSFRGVELVNCDVDRLVVNGVNVGNLIRLLQGSAGGL